MCKKISKSKVTKGLKFSNPFVRKTYFDYVVAKIFEKGEENAGVTLQELYEISWRDFYYSLRDRIESAQVGDCRKSDVLLRKYYKRGNLMTALHMAAALAAKGGKIARYFDKLKKFKFDEQGLSNILLVLSEDADRYEASIGLMASIVSNNTGVMINNSFELIEKLGKLPTYDFALQKLLVDISAMNAAPQGCIWEEVTKKNTNWGEESALKIINLWQKKFDNFDDLAKGFEPLLKSRVFPTWTRLQAIKVLCAVARDEKDDALIKLATCTAMQRPEVMIGQGNLGWALMTSWEAVRWIFANSKYPASNTFIELDSIMGYTGFNKLGFFTSIRGDYPRKSRLYSPVLRVVLEQYAEGKIDPSDCRLIFALCIRMSRYARNCYDFGDLIKRAFDKALAEEKKVYEEGHTLSNLGSVFLPYMADISFQPNEQATEMLTAVMQMQAGSVRVSEAVLVVDWCRKHGYPRPVFGSEVEAFINEGEKLLAILSE